MMKGTIEQSKPYVFGDFHTVHLPLVEQLDQLEKISQRELSVLFFGETGTGKELLARAVHQNDPHRHGNFIPINCASIPENLLESELFGHERGAFTSADAKKPGQLVLADSGTLFLDEIGELPKSHQPRLLRALEDKAVQPVGSTKLVPTDFRLICATNRDLKAMVAHREFRDDLYYRICGFVFEIPPLRERKEDIDLLGNHFLEKYAAHYQTQVSKLSPLVRSQLKAHDWPGNGRELESVIHEAVALCEGDVVERVDLPPAYQETDDTQTSLAALMAPPAAVLECEIILDALHENDWHRERTAKALGINRRTLYRKMAEHGITNPR
jgi:transcriptional regulator with PAS, ATPase and Fis domain